MDHLRARMRALRDERHEVRGALEQPHRAGADSTRPAFFLAQYHGCADSTPRI